MNTKFAFATYNIWTDNDIHKVSLFNTDGLTYEDILEAIERQKWIKKHEIKLSNEDLLEIENLQDYKRRLKKEFVRATCNTEYLGKLDKKIKIQPERIYIQNFMSEVKNEFPNVNFTCEYNEDFQTWETTYSCKNEEDVDKSKLGKIIRKILLNNDVYNFHLDYTNRIREGGKIT